MTTPVLDPTARVILTDGLREGAQAQHAMYPQYDGFFDDWVLCVITQSVRFKGSSEFCEGQIVLASPEVTLIPGAPAYRSTYDPRTGSVCGTPHEFIREIQEVQP